MLITFTTIKHTYHKSYTFFHPNTPKNHTWKPLLSIHTHAYHITYNLISFFLPSYYIPILTLISIYSSSFSLFICSQQSAHISMDNTFLPFYLRTWRSFSHTRASLPVCSVINNKGACYGCFPLAWSSFEHSLLSFPCSLFPPLSFAPHPRLLFLHPSLFSLSQNTHLTFLRTPTAFITFYPHSLPK